MSKEMHFLALRDEDSEKKTIFARKNIGLSTDTYFMVTKNRYSAFLVAALLSTCLMQAQTALKAGTYYLQNVATGKYLTAGANLGYRGILNDHGIDVKVSGSGSSYKLTTNLNQVGRVLKSSDGYLDGENETWKIETRADGTYTLYSASKSGYYGYDPTDGHPYIVRFLSSNASTNAHWRFWTKAALTEKMSEATKDNPVDASFLLAAPDFLRGDQRIYTDHCWGEDLTALNGNKSSSSYLVNSHNAEQIDKASFNVSQTITVPNGLYKVTVQAFYRYGGSGSRSATAFLNGTEEPLVHLYANTKSVDIMSLYSQAQMQQSEGFNLQVDGVGYVPNDQSQAAACFTDGYFVNVLENVYVTDNTLTVGIRKDNKAVSNDWTCFDNFTLIYYGNDYTDLQKAALQTWEEYEEKTVEGGDASTYQTTMAQLKTQLENSTGFEAINDAVQAIITAYQVYLSSPDVIGLPLNLTELLVNADFGQGAKGWTVEANKPANVKFDTSTRPATMEAYAGADVLDLKTYSIKQEQPVTLSPGYYRLTAYAFYRYSSSYNSDKTNPRTYAQLVAGDQKQDIMRLGDLQRASYPNSMAEAASVFSAGDYANVMYFRVTEPTPVSIGFEGTHRIKQSWFITGPVTLEKVSENQTLEKCLVRWTFFKDIAGQALDHTAFDAVLEQAMKCTTEEELLAADSQVYDAFCTLLKTGKTANGLFDFTSYVKNPTFDQGTEAWQATSEVKWIDAGVAETFSQTNNVIQQTLKGMPAGHYTVKVQAYHRTSDTSTSNNTYEAGKDPVAAQLFIGDEAVDVKNINDDSRYLSAVPSEDVAGVAQRSIPISLSGASAAFKLGLYWNTVSTDLAEGDDLTFGLRVKNGKSANWLPFDNFRLYYGTSLPTVHLTSTEPYAITEDTRANVTTDVTLKAGEYNKVCFPFDMTSEQVSANFTEVYTLGGVTSDGSSLKGLLVPATSIKAGNAYLVKVASDRKLAVDDVLLRAAVPDSIPVIWDGAFTKGNYTGCTFDICLPRDYQPLASTLTFTPIDYASVSFTTNLENWQIRHYLNENTYTKESPSVFPDYQKAPPAHRDQPHSVFIPVPENNEELTLTVTAFDGAPWPQASAETPAYSKTYPAGTTLCEVPNLIPQQDYQYKVEAAGAVLTQGRFRTEGRLRMIKANSGSNIRDLGGWLNADGNRLRYGYIYRGGELNAGHVMNTTDLKELLRLGIGAEIDLREDKDFENNQPTTRSALGSSVLYTYENLTQWEVDALTTKTDKFKDAFELLMRALRENRALYFHCIWGADRTGCFAFLLEGLLGLSVDQLYKDYELTSYSHAGPRVKTNLDAKINYISALPGATLQKKFFHYWNQQVGIPVADLTEFIERMVEGESSLTHSDLAFDAAANSYFQNPATIPVLCSVGSTIAPDARAKLQKVGEETTTLLEMSIDGILVRMADFTLEPSSRYTVTIPSGSIVGPDGKANAEDCTLAFRTPLFFDGAFYLYFTSLSKFLSRGEKWSTRIAADNYGMPAFIATDEHNVTTVRFLDSNLYMGSDSYTDKAADYNTIDWTLERSGKNYILKSANGKYLKMSSTGASSIDGDIPEDAARIAMVTREEHDATVEATHQKNIISAIRASGLRITTWEQAQKILASLTPTSTKITIKNAKTGNADVWVLTEPEYAQAVSPTEYNVGTYGSELYQRCGTISQTVEVPNEGLYRLTLNALYREGSASLCYALGEQGYEISNAFVSVNNTYFARIPSWYSSCSSSTKPSTTTEARSHMNAGKYAMEVLAYIGKAKKATITIHVPGYVAEGWCLFNNFALTELVVPDAIQDLEADSLNSESSILNSIYNLSGQRVTNPSRGIYIIGGKKVLKQ